MYVEFILHQENVFDYHLLISFILRLIMRKLCHFLLYRLTAQHIRVFFIGFVYQP